MDFNFKSLEKALSKIEAKSKKEDKPIIAAVCNNEYYNYLLRVFEKDTKQNSVMYFNSILGILLYRDTKQKEPWIPFYEREELDKYLNRKE